MLVRLSNPLVYQGSRLQSLSIALLALFGKSSWEGNPNRSGSSQTSVLGLLILAVLLTWFPNLK